jgi:cysteine-rich repeat protein
MNLIKTTLFILLTVLFALIGNSAIAEQTSANYRIINQVLPAGGGYRTSTGYTLSSVLGQSSPIGEPSNSNYSLTGGFLARGKIAPASCQIYAVNDKGLNNSQFFTVSLDGELTVSKLGSMYKGYDIEALAIHPKTDMIYAASGDDATNGKKGHFYRVDGETGELFPVGSTGFKEIEDLTFSPFSSDGTTLYAWAKGDGLITIDDLTTGESTLISPYNKSLIEGLTLKKNEGNVFFGAVGTDLWQYDKDADTLKVICPNGLLGETEALEIIPDGLIIRDSLITPDGLLLVGTHNVPFGLHAFDAQKCKIIEAETLSNQFNDVEGIAVPVAACRVCGDGIIQPNEQCDDGNIISGDGCSDVCLTE